jgi:23S rRNA pseudouridine2605 synthase
MAEALDLQVAKLQRVRYAGLDVEGLRPGRWRTLRREEVDGLRRLAGIKVPQQPRDRTARRR